MLVSSSVAGCKTSRARAHPVRHTFCALAHCRAISFARLGKPSRPMSSRGRPTGRDTRICRSWKAKSVPGRAHTCISRVRSRQPFVASTGCQCYDCGRFGHRSPSRLPSQPGTTTRSARHYGIIQRPTHLIRTRACATSQFLSQIENITQKHSLRFAPLNPNQFSHLAPQCL